MSHHRNAAKLIGAGGAAVGALAALAGIHDRLVYAGADLVLVGSLVGLARVAFRLVDDSDEPPPNDPPDSSATHPSPEGSPHDFDPSNR